MCTPLLPRISSSRNQFSADCVRVLGTDNPPLNKELPHTPYHRDHRISKSWACLSHRYPAARCWAAGWLGRGFVPLATQAVGGNWSRVAPAAHAVPPYQPQRYTRRGGLKLDGRNLFLIRPPFRIPYRLPFSSCGLLNTVSPGCFCRSTLTLSPGPRHHTAHPSASPHPPKIGEVAQACATGPIRWQLKAWHSRNAPSSTFTSQLP